MRKLFAALVALAFTTPLAAQKFEPAKVVDTSVKSTQISIGAAFSQNFQGLRHSNAATPKVVNGVNQNQLIELGNGFNLATANLYLTAKLAPGATVYMTSYLSSRHHNEAWVKDGYFLIDASPLNIGVLNSLMKYATVKAGHFEIDYGDQHVRRTDNGNAMENPFIGNLILDAMTTEIGGEVFLRKGALITMVGATSGENKGDVQNRAQSSPAWLTKVGFDKTLAPNIRVRLTNSTYSAATSPAVTLYGGDRDGTPYFSVMENTASTYTANAFSGTINPNFKNMIHAQQLNPFVKLGALDLFGVRERTKGRMVTEKTYRKAAQDAVDGVLHLNSRLYLAGRYNTVTTELAGVSQPVTIDRRALGAGWTVFNGVLLKGELVDQKYTNFPKDDIRYKGEFKGFMIGGAVRF